MHRLYRCVIAVDESDIDESDIGNDDMDPFGSVVSVSIMSQLAHRWRNRIGFGGGLNLKFINHTYINGCVT